MANEPVKCPECGSGSVHSYVTGIKTFQYVGGQMEEESDWQEDSDSYEYFSCDECFHDWTETN